MDNQQQYPRFVEIDVEMEHLDEIPPIQFHIAIGYLSCWAKDSERYRCCRIYNDGKTGDLIAHYFNSENKRTMTIGAIWRGDKYSFHS